MHTFCIFLNKIMWMNAKEPTLDILAPLFRTADNPVHRLRGDLTEKDPWKSQNIKTTQREEIWRDMKSICKWNWPSTLTRLHKSEVKDGPASPNLAANGTSATWSARWHQENRKTVKVDRKVFNPKDEMVPAVIIRKKYKNMCFKYLRMLVWSHSSQGHSRPRNFDVLIRRSRLFVSCHLWEYCALVFDNLCALCWELQRSQLSENFSGKAHRVHSRAFL